MMCGKSHNERLAGFGGLARLVEVGRLSMCASMNAFVKFDTRQGSRFLKAQVARPELAAAE